MKRGDTVFKPSTHGREPRGRAMSDPFTSGEHDWIAVEFVVGSPALLRVSELMVEGKCKVCCRQAPLVYGECPDCRH